MKTKLFTIALFILLTRICHGQINGQFTNTSIIGEKWKDIELVIPIEIKLTNTDNKLNEGTVNLSLDKSKTIGNDKTQISSTDFEKIEIRNNSQQYLINKNGIKKTFYIVIKKDLEIKNAKSLFVNLEIENRVISKTEIQIKRGNDITYTLNDYLNNPDLKLDYVSKVESNNNILTVYGYKNSNSSKINVLLEKEKVLAINEWSSFWNSKHWKPLPLSITTIPFKIRPERTIQDTLVFNKFATSGISNIGFNLDITKFQMDRYFSTGRKSTHKFSLGFWAAPSVEELDSMSTIGYLAKDIKSKQLFISTGITISYSYNDISFVFVPLGLDINTSIIGKNWIYNKQPWWGFGIAISPKIFSTILNK